MPYYYMIDEEVHTVKKRVAQRLLDLRELADKGRGEVGDKDYIAAIPERTLNNTLLLATWNIREFDSPSYGERSNEAMFYIAEIISRFDLIAIQEVKKDLSVLDRLRWYLGRNWEYVVTDETAGTKGNDERLAFFYDRRKVRCTGLAGEIVLPVSNYQFARTPFIVGFQSGWFKFSMCTVHILYGRSRAEDPERIQEIRSIAEFLNKRMLDYRKDYAGGKLKKTEYENIIVLGDFNIFGIEDETYWALYDSGFVVSSKLIGQKTNIGKQHRTFDQIVFSEDSKNVLETGNAGVFNYYKAIYKDAIEDRDNYAQDMQSSIQGANQKKSTSKQSKGYDQRSEAGKTQYYRTYWRTFQMSDHLPLWIELKIDFSGEYLGRRAVSTQQD